MLNRSLSIILVAGTGLSTQSAHARCYPVTRLLLHGRSPQAGEISDSAGNSTDGSLHIYLSAGSGSDRASMNCFQRVPDCFRQAWNLATIQSAMKKNASHGHMAGTGC
jgi:hypothetical protein